MSTKTIPAAALQVLQHAECDGPYLRLTGTLDRKLYVSVNKVLEALGGKWNRGKKAHVFDGNASEAIGDAVSAGEYLDAKQAFQFFETPSRIAKTICEWAGVDHGHAILEPSAGNGAISVVAASCGGEVDCIDIDRKRCDVLESLPIAFRRVENANFLELSPASTPSYDAVVMNPPFTKSQDIAHVLHAWEFLKPGGVLVSVMSIGWTFRTDGKAAAFRQWVADVGATYDQLPEGAFKSSGTGVRTVLVRAEKEQA